MGVYEPRTYRKRMLSEDLLAFRVVVEQTDLHIQVSHTEEKAEDQAAQAAAREAVLEARRAVQTELAFRPNFLASLQPLSPREDAPPIVRSMYEAGARAAVGPMAAVAGALAEFVGRRLLATCDQVIIENGGDIFLSTLRPRTVAVFAGRSPLSNKIGLEIPAGETLGICASSGTVGHSRSEGKADAAVVVADDVAFADAMATALGNRVNSPQDIEGAVNWAAEIAGVRQAMIVMGEVLGVAGEFELSHA